VRPLCRQAQQLWRRHPWRHRRRAQRQGQLQARRREQHGGGRGSAFRGGCGGSWCFLFTAMTVGGAIVQMVKLRAMVGLMPGATSRY